MRLDRVLAVVGLALAFLSAGSAAAEKLAVTQYGRITASLPWAVAMKKGFFKAEGLEIEEIFTFADVIPRVTWLVGVATPQFAASQPDKLRALIRVRRKGVDFIYANREEAAAIYAEIWETQRAEVDRFFPKYFDMPGEWQRGEFDRDGLKTMSDGLQLIGEVDKPIDWNAIIDQRFLPDDLRRPL